MKEDSIPKYDSPSGSFQVPPTSALSPNRGTMRMMSDDFTNYDVAVTHHVGTDGSEMRASPMEV